MTFAFYLAGAIAIASTSLAITRLNAVHALLYLVVSFLSVALILLLLGAPFAAAFEVIIYAGAIMVLFAFVVMMLGPAQKAASEERRWLALRAWLGPALLAAVLVAELIYVVHAAPGQATQVIGITPHQIAVFLLGPYILGVELVSLVLLLGLVGAFHLAYQLGKRERSLRRGVQP